MTRDGGRVKVQQLGLFLALPLVLLGRQLTCSLQVFVDEFLLCARQAGLVSAVIHGVLPFSLKTQR